MKINSNFKLRHIAGETIIINQGTPDADLANHFPQRFPRVFYGMSFPDRNFL